MSRRVNRLLRIGLAQINATVGDFTGNRKKILDYIDKAKTSGVDLLMFPELVICGYPPEDLLFKPRFITENLRSLGKVVEAARGINVVAGFVDEKDGIYNSAAIISDGRLAAVYHKVLLPNYGVFDEARYFKAGTESPVYVVGGIKLGISICEDIWYEDGPPRAQAYSGAEVIANISASPYHFGKGMEREEMIRSRAVDNVAIVALNNLVAGQDELIFDGGSIIVDEKGNLIDRGKQFAEDLVIADLDVESVRHARRTDRRWRQESLRREKEGWHKSRHITVSKALLRIDKPPLRPRKIAVLGYPAEVYSALVLGTRDYVGKNGFEKVIVGLSGGLDSSLVATVAVDALGNSNVIGVSMPSRYSSAGSVSDAGRLVANLGIELLTIPIEKIYRAYLETLSDVFSGTESNVAEENIQARIRGNILMAISNKFGWLVLTTGNKSEMATGYATLYGDMAGGFAVIKDVPKTMAYELARYRNSLAKTDLIPVSVIEKVPSAELRPDQKDTDSLPPYDLLDPVLTAYVEEDKSIDEIITMGIDEQVVKRAARLVDISEYKRRQAPPGIKITARAFGKDRRLPITNRFNGGY
jgi:NAD+ synthase (glutamine-hydrolysing)